MASTDLSRHLTAYHAARGTRVVTNFGVAAFDTSGGSITSVRGDDGSSIPCDHALIGIGAAPNTELARRCGVACDGGILVDRAGHTNVDAIMAIGDVTRRPHDALDGLYRLESIPSAVEQAKHAASAITHEHGGAHETPWFWSDQFDLKLKIAGILEDGPARSRAQERPPSRSPCSTCDPTTPCVRWKQPTVPRTSWQARGSSPSAPPSIRARLPTTPFPCAMSSMHRPVPGDGETGRDDKRAANRARSCNPSASSNRTYLRQQHPQQSVAYRPTPLPGVGIPTRTRLTDPLDLLGRQDRWHRPAPAAHPDHRLTTTLAPPDVLDRMGRRQAPDQQMQGVRRNRIILGGTVVRLEMDRGLRYVSPTGAPRQFSS